MGKFGEINDVLVILKDHASDPDADPITGDFDISNKWSVIEYEDGQPQAVKITLNTRAGRFLTKDPIIQKRDRIYVQITDKNGNVTKDVFHVRRRKRNRQNGKAISLTLTCPHQSENLWKKTVSYKRRGKRISGNRAIEIMVNDLNQNKATKDPAIEIPAFDTVTKTGNAFDRNTSNNYFFEASKVQSAIDEIKDIEQQPVEGGGSFEPFYFRFVSKYDHGTGDHLDTVLVQAFPQGYQDDGIGNFVNIPNVTLKHPKLGSSERPNVLSLDSNEDPEEGTNLIAIGDKASGSWLRDWMMYVGSEDVFNSARQWQSGQEYKKGHLVTSSINGLTYECITNHTSSGDEPPSANWIQRTFTKPNPWNTVTIYTENTLVRHQDIAYKSLTNANQNNEPGVATDHWTRVFFVPTVDYSPLTKNRAQYWINALGGAKYSNQNNGRTSMIDPNCIIEDDLHPRTYVRFIGTDPTNIPSDHLIDGNIPHGYKALVIDPTNGTEVGGGIWNGSDKNNIPYPGKIVQFLDPDFDGVGEWVVFKAKLTEQDQEVYDWDESESWTKEPGVPVFTLGIPDRYVNGDGECLYLATGLPAPRSTVWEKGSYGLSELPLIGKVGVFFVDKQFECVHSVKWDSFSGNIDLGNEKITNADNDANSAVFVKSAPLDVTRTFPYYVGFNFWSLWPLTSNDIPHGPVTAGETVKLPTLDLDNMDQTRKATSEWFGPLVEEYFPFQAIAMWMNFAVNDQFLGVLDDLDGDFTIGIWLADINDQEMALEFPISRNSKTMPAQGEFGKLKAYRGVPGVSAFFSAEEPNPTVAFDPTEIIVGGIYTRDSFDTQGRYLGVRSRFANKSELKMSIDAFRMIKPLVATNIDEANAKPSVDIETLKIDKSSITSYAQLKNFILGIDKFLNFDRRSFTMEVTNGRDIQFGDSVYFTDPEAVNDSDDGIQNTVKVVADKITISLSKTKNGPAGFKKYVDLVRRVWP